MQRRKVLQWMGGLTCLALCPHAQARPTAMVESLIHDLPRTAEALFDLTRGAVILPSTQIELITEPLVEYAPRWPVRMVNRMPGASWMALVIEQNPQPLAAVFHFKSTGLNEIGLNLKIVDSTQVTVIVAVAGKYFGQRRFITVVGNCG